MRDNEIIKALACCTNDDHCGDCFLVYGQHDCNEKRLNLLKDALSLINRQKAEIETLNRELRRAERYLNQIADDWGDWDD